MTEWLAFHGISVGFRKDYKSGIDKLRDNTDLVIYSRGIHSVLVNTTNDPTRITMTTQKGPTTWSTSSAGDLCSALKWLARTNSADKIGVDSF